MNKIRKVAFLITAGLFWSGLASAATTTHSHTALAPVFSDTASGWQEARLWFLPDWQSDTRSFNSNTSDDKGGGDKPDLIGKCGTYGLIESCGSPKVSTGAIQPAPGLTCQKGCKCPTSYQYTSSNCTGDREVGGTTCDGKYNQCNLKTCPTAAKCDYKCKTYSPMSHCSSVCIECDTDPCPGYYDCGGSWQYCEGSTCPADSSKCSVYCESDYFPYSCRTGETCPGIQRGNYCSVPCVSTCTYTTTASDCAEECKNAGSSSCTRDGTTYYASCGASKCGSNQSCSAGSCVSTCTNTITASDCAAECKNAGSSSCTRDGTTYYASCGSSKCGSDQSCSSGSCVDNCTPLTDESSCSWGSKNCADNCGGIRSCCKTAAEYCSENGYTQNKTCEAGQNTEVCSADSSYKKCTGSACPSSKTCQYGCQTYSTQSGCENVCTACYADNCHERTEQTCDYGCLYHFSDCSSKCQTCYDNNCRNRTSQTCTYGCQNYFSDCSYKCETCYADNCRNRTESIPANASCSAKFPDCDSKCQSWDCNSGYTKKYGNSCVCATTCADSFNPDNLPNKAALLTESCTACGETATITTGYKCFDGFDKKSPTTYSYSNYCQPVRDACEQEIFAEIISTKIPVYTLEDIKTYWSDVDESRKATQWYILGNVGSYSGDLPTYIAGTPPESCLNLYPQSKLTIGEGNSSGRNVSFNTIPFDAQTIKITGNSTQFSIVNGLGTINLLEFNSSEPIYVKLSASIVTQDLKINTLMAGQGAVNLNVNLSTIKNVRASSPFIENLYLLGGKIDAGILSFIKPDVLISAYVSPYFIGEIPSGIRQKFIFHPSDNSVKDTISSGCDENGNNCTHIHEQEDRAAWEVWEYDNGSWNKQNCSFSGCGKVYCEEIRCQINGTAKIWKGSFNSEAMAIYTLQ